jgi:hypothetical protein
MAKAQIRDQIGPDRNQNQKRSNIYFCPRCQAWHYGRTRIEEE